MGKEYGSQIPENEPSTFKDVIKFLEEDLSEVKKDIKQFEFSDEITFFGKTLSEELNIRAQAIGALKHNDARLACTFLEQLIKLNQDMVNAPIHESLRAAYQKRLDKLIKVRAAID